MHGKVPESGLASIIYPPPIPTIKPVMSWFNSPGEQAYSRPVSINVNYPGLRAVSLSVAPAPPTLPGSPSMQHDLLDVKWRMWRAAAFRDN